jgi:hypothetical protein
MNFSAIQWFALVGLDLFLRAAYFVAVTFNILLIPVALFLSILHFVVLGLAQLLAARLKPQIRRPAVAIAVANVLFAAAMALLWIVLIRDGSVTGCMNGKCDWVNGVITPDGVRTILSQTVIQIILNLVPVAIAICIIAVVDPKKNCRL